VSRYDLLMAGTLISVAPVIILYLIVQRWVTDAFLRSGIKG
jgi:ABC-type glycerol-3-phosphate transport system permease component